MSNLILGGVSAILDAVWPRRCFVCGEFAAGSVVCADCAGLLPRLPRGLCPVCALPSPVMDLPCGRCQRRAFHFDATRAAFTYDHPVRELILGAKHGPGLEITNWMGRLLAELVIDLPADCVVPVPLHTARLALRGYNQACEMARIVARRCRIELKREAVVRDIDTPKLSGLRSGQRRHAMRGAFRCLTDFSGRHVIVLDDVMTSGSTLDELARTLKQRGASRVTALVFARALRRLPN